MMSKFFYSVILLLCSATLLAQSAPPAGSPSSQTPSQQMPSAHRGGQGGGCLQQAGIDKSVMEQIRSISSDARSRVEAVCSNTSLTAQQRQQEAREIREQAMRKRDALMTSDQRQALASCRQEHGEGSGMHESGTHQGVGGGCEEMPRGGARNGGYSRGPGNGGGNPAPSSAPASSSAPQN